MLWSCSVGKRYYAIPYRNTDHPPISIWELQAICRRLQELGRKEIDEDLIFRTYEEMRSDEFSAVNETKKARKQKQKRTYYSQIEYPAQTFELKNNESYKNGFQDKQSAEKIESVAEIKVHPSRKTVPFNEGIKKSVQTT